MASTHLSLPIRLPFEDRERHARLDALTTRVANTLIERYWTPEHLTGIDDHSYQALKYFDEHEAFADVLPPESVQAVCDAESRGNTPQSR